MSSASWWLEWPQGVVRVGVVFLVASVIAAVVVSYPGVLREAGRDAERNSDLSYSDREIAGGNGLVADQAAAYAARGLIPESDTFKVLVDPAFAGGSAETVQFVDSFYRYFLMPRRPAEGASWIICYGCDLAPYGERAEVVWEGEDDISIVRLA
jgi:hypothetical protein